MPAPGAPPREPFSEPETEDASIWMGAALIAHWRTRSAAGESVGNVRAAQPVGKAAIYARLKRSGIVSILTAGEGRGEKMRVALES
jgi:hypothetical protein